MTVPESTIARRSHCFVDQPELSCAKRQPNVRLQLTLGETVAIQEDPMTADVLATRVASGIAVSFPGQPSSRHQLSQSLFQYRIFRAPHTTLQPLPNVRNC
jgi:hypothetical protein